MNETRDFDVKRFGTAAWLIPIVIAFLLHSWYLRCVAEDAFITFRFAEHLVQGHGLVWNLSEPAIEGYTNFLWVLVSSALMLLDIDVLKGTQVLGMVLGAGLVVGSYVFSRTFFGSRRLPALVAPLMLMASGPLATWSSSGMETTAFTFMLFASVAMYLRYWQSNSAGVYVAVGALFFLSSLLRPEAVWVFALCLFLGVVRGIVCRQFLVSHNAGFALAFIVPFVAYSIWRWATFGDLLPNTYYAKMGGGIEQLIRGAKYDLYFAFFFVSPLIPVTLLGLWNVTPAPPRDWFDIQRLRRWAEHYFPQLVCALLFGSYMAYIAYVGGDYMAMFRFMVPALPYLYLLIVPLVMACQQAGLGNLQKLTLVAAITFAVGGSFLHSTPYELLVFKKPPRQHGNYRGVQTERWHVHRLTVIARYFNSIGEGPKTSLATRAIGAIGYYTDLEIHDLLGLTDRHIAKLDAVAGGLDLPAHEKQDLDYSFGRHPDYFMIDRDFSDVSIVDSLTPDGSAADVANFLERNYPRHSPTYAAWIREHPEFYKKHYRIQETRLVDNLNGETGFFVYLARVP